MIRRRAKSKEPRKTQRKRSRQVVVTEELPIEISSEDPDEVLVPGRPSDPTVKDLLASLHETVSQMHGGSKHQPCSDIDFRRMWEHLKSVVPPPTGTKVVIRRVPSAELPADHGYCEKVRNVFNIVLDRNLTYYETEDKLIHEWAHMLNWKPHHPLEQAHGPTWGVEYAKVYSAYHGTL